MARFAITWSLDGRPFARALDPSEKTMYVIGREPSADIVVSLPTVSRRQARLAWTGSRFEVENLSPTNPIHLDGRTVTSSAAVGDGSRITAGDAVLVVHDLTAGDRISGPRCSHCGRENKSGDPECWFCGTSLVNALTGVRTKRRLILRLVDATGGRSDLVEGHAMQPRAEGGWDEIPAEAPAPADGPAPAIVIDAGHPTSTVSGDVVVEDAAGAARSPGPIETGDVVVAGGRRYAAISR
jgi:hypothetical protein